VTATPRAYPFIPGIDDGWHHLLPSFAAGRLLCLDLEHGCTALGLAAHGASVTAIHPDADESRRIAAHVADAGAANVQSLCIGTEARPLPFPDGAFDGVVVHDLEARVLRRGRAAPLDQLLAETRRLVRPGGFVYVAAPNSLGYSRFSRGLPQGARATGMLSGSRLRRHLRQAGYRAWHTHPLLFDGLQVFEVVPPCGYTSVKNRFRRRERVKELLIGRRGRTWLAPGYAFVAFRDATSPPRLELLQQHLRARGFLGPPAATELKRFLLLQGKNLYSFGPHGGRFGELVVIVARSARALSRRQREAAVLDELHQARPGIESLVPRLRGQGIFEGEHYFVHDEVQGISVDAVAPYLDDVTRKAVVLLERFHRATAEPRRIGDAAYEPLFGRLFEQARATHPEVAPALIELERAVRERVWGRSVSQVWLHGDYKIENVLLDETTLEIRGLVDWELSLREGLPLIDLFYLILYNRSLRDRQGISAGYCSVLLPDALTPFEREQVESYLSTVPIERDLLPVLTAMFFVHHIGFRVHLGNSGPEFEGMCTALARTQAMFSRTSPARSGALS
jgi:SAM-dependent methyltransferase